MDALPQFVVAGIPLIYITFAIVEEIKAYGLTGKVLRFVSLLVGLALALVYQFAAIGIPASLAGWLTAAIVGLAYGLSASGGYDFVDKRFPPSG